MEGGALLPARELTVEEVREDARYKDTVDKLLEMGSRQDRQLTKPVKNSTSRRSQVRSTLSSWRRR